MKKTILLTMMVAIVAISLFVYGCGPSAQAPEKKAPAANAPGAAAVPAPPTPPQTPAVTAPAATGEASAPAVPETAAANQAISSDSDLNQGVDESNPADLPEPSAP